LTVEVVEAHLKNASFRREEIIAAKVAAALRESRAEKVAAAGNDATLKLHEEVRVFLDY
jgi:hypothetical protein